MLKFFSEHPFDMECIRKLRNENTTVMAEKKNRYRLKKTIHFLKSEEDRKFPIRVEVLFKSIKTFTLIR